ncbi:2-dehydro-3-deoxygalactonokinase [Pukyongiella litopenaei]|uniref:2-dehydro-3-deoxygalactonokinase n=1 Tax=Pukyongiella litopenaei TaxID=2605946 RepID=A0A2S0MVX6_9RHOB|nr:2-dehydro-3-deoxygalactonokinase [Pukyongiella litopenaei]AVO39833.1 2-dehydro-3-deoxygalactonokinase [Pukyongiella litopenaei]
MTDRVQAGWIAVDWGSSRLRAWAMRGDTVLDRAESDAGGGSLARGDFGPALNALVADWLGDGITDVLACGMVGARQGWVEAPYRAVPCPPLGADATAVADGDGRLLVRVIPGLKQASPPDVMRGEETQIAGFLSLNPNWDGVICLPGTHTKWVQVSAGEVVSFRTFMTGEIFALLGRHSVLRHSVGETGWDDAAFAGALGDAMSHPERIAAQLFSLRASDLLDGQRPETARARLSGLLTGAELAAARPYWLGQQIAVIGDRGPAQPYVAGLQAQGVPVTQADAARATLAGLVAARRLMVEAPR